MRKTGVDVKSWSTNCPYNVTQLVSVSCGASMSITTEMDTKRGLQYVHTNKTIYGCRQFWCVTNRKRSSCHHYVFFYLAPQIWADVITLEVGCRSRTAWAATRLKKKKKKEFYFVILFFWPVYVDHDLPSEYWGLRDRWNWVRDFPQNDFFKLLHEPSSVRKGERAVFSSHTGSAGQVSDKIVSLRLKFWSP